ncbi:hypothetical protein B0J17DRAFT_632573 [Rhizoctonia solani]|nr:hypothetical protein B0J17DRAFT_632573 [Rhizoctonia solani]
MCIHLVTPLADTPLHVGHKKINHRHSGASNGLDHLADTATPCLVDPPSLTNIKNMGRRTRTITSSSSKSEVWQQPGGDMLSSGAVNAGGLPIDHPEIEPEMVPLPATNLGDSRASLSMPVGSSHGSTVASEEENDYDMCLECVDTQEDGYVLVALEPTTLAGCLNKGQETSKM